MTGKIYFADLTELADFLAAFTGKSTATFEVRFRDNAYVLEFLGGY